MSTEPPIAQDCALVKDPGSHWFIYYQVLEDQLNGALAAAATLQRDLKRRFPSLRTHLMRRPGIHDGRVTLMEIYTISTSAGTAGPRVPSLADIEGQAARLMGVWLDGPRHVEVFEPCA